ncbi:sulfatase [Olivibacter sp. SDN3]|uniref:sulfatase family protein n=1 Tax=Olivibacter sp. SDN3 TaxID=2764720 RepID=UPI00165152CC|nr:sulfatase [Olivibacter sp. SDN3]QNL48215.1 sulfatase [Olivibacter sp. SDN3]
MNKLFRRLLFLVSAVSFTFCLARAQQHNIKRKPNFIVVFTDDQGYGDLGTYGSPTIKTPNIDQMANEGQKWTNFYVAANVCTPSRAGLLTGRLPIRSGMQGDSARVLFPHSKGGLPETEITIASLLKQQQYQTAIIGKWHLGSQPEFLPTKHGFDYYFGIPYSNDMDRVDSVPYVKAITEPKNEYFQVPLMRNEEIIERPAIQNTLTERYTEEAVQYIRSHQQQPFFLYLAHSMPHVPLFANKKFEGKSARGLYGDVIEEIDWSVGEILKTLKDTGLDQDTYVVFITDNGPWKLFRELGGSSGPLYGAKGNSYEGGVRVPAVFWAPGRVKHRQVTEIGSTLDILSTIASLADAKLPTDRVYDGFDLSDVLIGKSEKSPREEMFYYHGSKLVAVRKGAYKLNLYSNSELGYPEALEKLEKPQLFNLNEDIAENYDVADKHSDTVDELVRLVDEHKRTVKPVVSQLDIY